jgi:hypothetical protein
VAHGYVRRPGTDRIPEEGEKKFLRNRYNIVIPVKKVPQERKTQES